MSCSDKVCPECPFRRQSAPGYLGTASYDPHAFVDQHYHGDVRLPCHMQVDWDKKESQRREGRGVHDAPLCRGFVTFMKNNCKFPENQEVKEAMATVEKDVKNIFNWYSEFIIHHTK